MKKKAILLCFLLCIERSYSDPAIDSIKDLTKPLKKSFLETGLNPSYGALEALIGSFEVQSGPKSDSGENAIISEIKKNLFHSPNPFPMPILPGTAKGNIGKYINAEMIGIIQGHLFKKKEINVEEFIENVKLDLFHGPTQKGQEIIKLDQAQTNGNLQNVKVSKQQQKAVLRRFKKILQKINEYIKSKKNDKKEETPSKLSIVLNVLLWRKSSTKENYISYYKGIKSVAPEAINETLSSDKKQRDWLSSRFQKKEKYRFSDLSGVTEKLIYTVLKSADNSFQIVPEGTAAYLSESFGDCGSTLLKNFFRLFLLKKPSELSKDGESDYLIDEFVKEGKSLGLEIDGELIRYFKDNYSKEESQFSLESRSAWVKITSGLNKKYEQKNLGPPVMYRNELAECNISSEVVYDEKGNC